MAENRGGCQPDMSVVVPFLNEEKWLPHCLRALEAQTLPPGRFEVILIDNGSTDRSAEIAASFGRATLLHESCRDPYLARNRGIGAARGRYVIFLDADCVAQPDWLERLAAEIDRSAAPIVLGYLAYPDSNSSLLRRQENYYDAKLRYLLDNRLRSYYFGHAGNMAVRRDVFESLGPFLAMPIVGDTEIIHRLLERSPEARVAYASSARVVHSEVNSFAACLAKLYECGIHSETYTNVSGYRLLPLAEKWRIFRRSVQDEHYGPWATLESLLVLLAGFVSFQCGRLRPPAGRLPDGRPGHGPGLTGRAAIPSPSSPSPRPPATATLVNWTKK